MKDRNELAHYDPSATPQDDNFLPPALRICRVRDYCVYIMSSRTKRLYVGVTSHLERRAYEHKNHSIEGFTRRYNIEHLVYYEHFSDPRSAIAREKQIKGWLRSKKISLIEEANPGWHDLANLGSHDTVDVPTAADGHRFVCC